MTDRLDAHFDLLETIGKSDHWWRYVLECRCCGQRYVFNFHETIDWASGRDPQMSVWVPVSGEDQLKALRTAPPQDLSGFAPRLVKNWPSDKDAPEIGWIMPAGNA